MEESSSRLADKSGIGASVRASQLLASRMEMTRVLDFLFRAVGSVIREEQANAAALAEELLLEDERGIWKIVEPDSSKREGVFEDMTAQARRQIQATMARIFKSQKTLSSRIYRTEALSKGQVSRVIERHISIGSSAKEMADDLKKMIDPKAPGGVSYRATLLARTEINNAFHAQSIADAQSRPWIEQVYWNLSKSHNEEGCRCEVYARQRVFPASQVPEKPHPQCLCSITPKLPDLDTALKDYMAGRYGARPL